MRCHTVAPSTRLFALILGCPGLLAVIPLTSGPTFRPHSEVDRDTSVAGGPASQRESVPLLDEGRHALPGETTWSLAGPLRSPKLRRGTSIEAYGTDPVRLFSGPGRGRCRGFLEMTVRKRLPAKTWISKSLFLEPMDQHVADVVPRGGSSGTIPVRVRQTKESRSNG